MAGFANTFAVPGVASASGTFGGALQGGSNTSFGKINTASIVPPPETGSVKGANTFASVPDFSKPIAATIPSTSPTKTFSQVYNGITYTDPNALAEAQAKDAAAFKPVIYNGQTYNDPTQYANAVISDVKGTHDKNVSQINAAYQNGLLTFDQKQKLIDQNRQSLTDQLHQTLDSQNGYFNSISPDAVQSQQGVLADKATTAEQQGQSTINDAQTQLGSDKSLYNANYQNSLTANDQNQQQGIDAANNSVLQNQENTQSTVQGILDSGKNAAASFANSQPTSSTVNYDPATLIQNVASYLTNANSTGLTPDQQTQSITSLLGSQGLNAQQIAPILQYANSLVNNPNNPYGQAYSKKTPLSLASPAGS